MYVMYVCMYVCMYVVCMYVCMIRDAHQDLAKIGDLDSSSDRIK